MRVKNWGRFQHYKGRKPPWIRFYRDTLDDLELFEISDAAFRLLACCWLLASEDPEGEGNLPSIKVIAFRVRRKPKDVERLLGELAPWIHDASSALAICKQDAIPDKSRSDQKREDQIALERDVSLNDSFAAFWKAYPRKVGKQAAKKAFTRARRSGSLPVIDAVLSAIETAKVSKDWCKNNGQFIPHPTTWINRGGWDDETQVEGQGGLELIAELEAEEAANGAE